MEINQMTNENCSIAELSLGEMELISGGRPSDVVKVAETILTVGACVAEFMSAFATGAVSPGGVLHPADPWK
jgi:hypothetical protein